MKNYVQPGNVLTALTPAGGWVSGQLVQLSDTVFGVATLTTDEGVENEIEVEGVMSVPKLTGDAAEAFEPAYFDADTSSVSAVVGDPALPVAGYFTIDADAGAAVVSVKLRG